MIKRVWFILLLMFVAGCSGSLGPSAEELEKKFAVDLPSVWKLTSFKVTAEENTGTKTQPDVRSRFVATVELARDLYAPEAQLGDTLVVKKTKSVGEMKTELHGVARSQQSAGKWSISFNLENIGAVNISDKPLSDLGKHVILGSTDEKALRERVAKEEEAQRKAEAEASRLTKEKAEAIEKATAALFKPGTRLASRWTRQDGRSGALTFVIEKHDAVTRTFSGYTDYPDQSAYRLTGQYGNGKVKIVQADDPIRGTDPRSCNYDLMVTGSTPPLRGGYFELGRCGPGTIEVGLR